MILEIRAEDRASATINRVGGSAQTLMGTLGRGSLNAFAYSQAFDAVGRGMTRAGIAIIGATGAAVKSNLDFSHAMALANTQAQLSKKSLDQLSVAALEVSSRFGVAGTEIAESLYDIFSTTEQTADQAIKSVNALSKAAVAGDVQMREATRGVVDIQNAFGKSAGSVTDVLNRQFAMLRISGGTYGELVNAFGNVIGSAKATDQALESVSGSIAFLTLRGRSQAEASISVSRALDQITRSAGDIKDVLGVSVYDATGNFRQLNDIITDMGKKMADMTTEERSQAFEDMFGAGSIQANRFFRTAIPQFEQLNASVAQLEGSKVGGELAKQFQIMKQQDPSFVFERLKTQVTNLGIAFAHELMPDLLKVADWLGRLADAFNNLDPGTKKLIARVVALGGVFLLVGGKILTFVATMLRLRSVFQLAGILNNASKGVGIFGTQTATASKQVGTAASSTQRFGRTLSFLKGVVGAVGIMALVWGIEQYISTINDANQRSDVFFDKVEAGKKTFGDVTARVGDLSAELDAYANRSTWDQLQGVFSGDLLKGEGLETEINRLNDRLAEHKQEIQTVAESYLGASQEAKGWANAIAGAEAGTKQQKVTLAAMIGNLERMGVEMSDSARFTMMAYLAQGNYNGALKIALGLMRGVTGALKNLASSQERTNDKVEIYNQKQQRSEHLTRGTSKAVEDFDRSVRNASGTADTAANSVQRWGSQAQSAGNKVKGATDKANDYVQGSPYNATLKAVDQASSTIASVAAKLAAIAGTTIVNIAANIIGGSGGGVIGNEQGGVVGMASGGMRRASFISQRPTFLVGEGNYSTFAGKGAEAVIPLHSRGLSILAEAVRRGIQDSGGTPDSWGKTKPMNVTVNARTTATADEIAREIDWAARTRGW